MKLIKRPTYITKFMSGGLIPKFQKAGKLPIGNRRQYDYVTEIYQNFVNKGVNPQAALDLTNLVVQEGGWFTYKTGDGKRFKNANDLTNHVIGHHSRLFPDTLKANNWESFYRGLNVTPKYKYNSERPNYKQWLYGGRPGIKKRINYYRSQQGLSPLAYQEPIIDQQSEINYPNII